MIKLNFQPYSDQLEIECFFEANEVVLDDMSFTIGVVKVSGCYPDGSAGSQVGQYLSSVGVFLRDHNDLSGIVWDFSSLTYNWGDGLRKSYRPNSLEFRSMTDPDDRDWYGYALISSTTNKEALAGLVEAFPTEEGVSLHDDLASAVKVIEDEINSEDWS